MSSPRNKEMHELSRELRNVEDRATALSVYDYPEGMSMLDMIVFAVTIYDTPNRRANPEQLIEVFSKCGQFGVVALEGAISSEYPYVHLGNFHDSLERLQQAEILEITDAVDLTSRGRQIGAAMLNGFIAASHEPTLVADTV